MSPPARRDLPAIPLILGCGALVRILLAFLPLRWQLAHILSDDAFYYFTIARRLSHTGFPSFDGLAPTNGFHPLWLGALSSLFAFPVGDEAAVRVALVLCALIDTVSLALLLHILKELHCGTFARIGAAGLYALTPGLLSYAGPLNGMETSLTILLLFSVLASFLARERHRDRWYGSPAMFGLFSGLLLLARTDSIAILLPLSFSVNPRDARRAGLVAILIVVPWLIWNLLTFGTIMQVSGEAYALSMNALLHMNEWGPVEYLKRFAENLADLFRFFPVGLSADSKWSWMYGAQCALMLVLAVISRRPGRLLHAHMRLLSAPIAGCVLFVLIHTVRTGTLRGWYYASLLPVLFIALGCALDRADRRLGGSWRQAAITAGTLATITLMTWSGFGYLSRDKGELPKADALPALRETIPAGAVVGSWNAGLFGYFLTERTVVNLDGLVNNPAYAHLRNRTLGAYCRSVGVSYIVDRPGAFALWGRFWSQDSGGMRNDLVFTKSRSDSMMIAILVAGLPLFFHGDSLAPREPYLEAVRVIVHDPSARIFLSGGGIRVVDSLFTLDRFPFDSAIDDTVVSVYKADVLRPLRSAPAPWLADTTSGMPAAGVLFVAGREGSEIVAELFPFNDGCHSYQEYTMTSHSLKYLLQIPAENRVRIARRVRLLR